MTNNHIGPIEIKMSNGEYFYTEVHREGNKLITGTPCNTGLILDPWEVDIDDHGGSLQEALQELYQILLEYSETDEALLMYS